MHFKVLETIKCKWHEYVRVLTLSVLIGAIIAEDWCKQLASSFEWAIVTIRPTYFLTATSDYMYTMDGITGNIHIRIGKLAKYSNTA